MDTQEQSSLIQHGPCDNCGSSDANAEYSDGHFFCFSCETHTPSASDKPKTQPRLAPDLIPVGQFNSLVKRKIREDTCRKFGYSISTYKGQTVQVANYKRNGQIIAQKIRFPNKDFLMLGNAKECGLFGQHLWKEGGKILVITEGEIDTLSVSQAISSTNNWPVVSIPQGAAGAARAIKKELEFVSSFKKVIIMMDSDEAGTKAASEIAALLKPNQAFIAELPAKDPSELLMKGQAKEIISAYHEAKPYRPDGIINGIDIWDDLIAEDNTESIPWPYDGLNKLTHGLRKGELITLTAGSGVGKSQVCREIAYHLIKQGETVGYVALEENVKRTALGLMGLAIDKPLHLSKEGVSNADLKSAFSNTVGSGRVYLYDHFGSMLATNLLDKIRYLAKGCDVGWVVLDHLSIVVSGIDDGDERKTIDVLMTQLRSLVEETGIGLILVSHLRRPEGNRGWEEGLTTSLNALRGSASIAQLSDSVIGLERNQQDQEAANQVTVRVLKNRFSGETGIATTLFYDKDTGRLSEHEFAKDEFEEY
jgi:twinkle protein